MSYGVINGLTGSYRITPARTKLPISSILPASDLVAGATPDTFVVQLTGLYQVDLNINLSSPSNNVIFKLELFNVTANSVVQSRTGTVPSQAYPSDMYFGFDWNNLSATDEYAFYITPDPGVFYKDYALLVSDLNFRAVVQMFGGSGVLGAGTAGKIPVWTAHDTQGDSIMTQAGATITVAGAVSLAGVNNATFLEFTDGQNVAVSAANQGRIRYNVNTQTFEFSENGGAWADLSRTTQSIIVAASDETSPLSIGAAKVTFRMPYAFSLTGVRASLTAAATGSSLIVDIKMNGVTIFATLLSIDATQLTSTTASVPAVLSTTALTNDASMTVDITQIGSIIAGAGLKVSLIGNEI